MTNEAFQSTLAPEGASDVQLLSHPSPDRCFNPRSHPRVRATCDVCHALLAPFVSIHARTRGCERRRIHGSDICAKGFQSTLAPEGASDQVSIAFYCQLKQFQSTLAPEGASDAVRMPNNTPPKCFNPRSHPRVRATVLGHSSLPPYKVSIHARTRGCERPYAYLYVGRVESFQSTLAPEGASDVYASCRRRQKALFQSTLAPEGASDNLFMYVPYL